MGEQWETRGWRTLPEETAETTEEEYSLYSWKKRVREGAGCLSIHPTSLAAEPKKPGVACTRVQGGLLGGGGGSLAGDGDRDGG